jgi:hypothetical protein
MIEFEPAYREFLKHRLPLIYFFSKKKVVDPQNYNYSTSVLDTSSDNITKKRTSLFRKPITKIQL